MKERPRKRTTKARRLGGPPENEVWVWFTASLIRSPTWQALRPTAMRIIFFLCAEHAEHGRKENGNLAAPYRELEAVGITADDIRAGLAELELLGFIDRTFQGLRQAGGGEPARYAITWFSTEGEPLSLADGRSFVAGPPAAATNRWKVVRGQLAKQGIVTARDVRKWVADRLREDGIGRGARRVAAERRAAPPPTPSVIRRRLPGKL